MQQVPVIVRVKSSGCPSHGSATIGRHAENADKGHITKRQEFTKSFDP